MQLPKVLLAFAFCATPLATGFSPLFSSLSKLPTPTPRASAESPRFPSPFLASTSLRLASGEDISLEDVESLSFKGKGKVGSKRGKSKPTSSAGQSPVTLAPEEVFYEGPPAITETLIPTLSILTVIGIIPAIASYSRQAWVRYKITSRRIRVTSGFGGRDMSEIVYPDVVEFRSVKRLLGDGDFVLFLKDGAKFEMRNVPKYEDTKGFILGQVSEEVKKLYESGGEIQR
mmetsp:Transcript_1410/g.2540  ORF Transcript_1410/g.2540 Transcript_1410/m.2540 type:complete len:230 (+) Transcript_1410:32-721(+)|eukprot:CAMPEP_0182464532 /NCGR_PEP_ID=MMETSP1319-20130603/8697_1 /TAXON_ID=172717 /ORGANISM="Bolidomonas pacifica, Strain RCC208" /LENGTH=229 /DNA_ID=CAMNT_0024664181 /DNA_START=31 /DNA_END=720 /DNA_ORIENTATION=+